MAKPKLALIPAAQGDKFYSVLPSSGVGDFDFTRSGGATRINSQGLIETVADGVSRLNYPLIDGKVVGCPSHLLEPQRTNLFQRSEEFSNAYWSTSRIETPYIADVVSPDGTLNAYTFEISSGETNGGGVYAVNISASGGSSISVFAKKKTANYLVLSDSGTTSNAVYFDLENGVVGTTYNATGEIQDFGNGWYRCTMKYTLTSSGLKFIYLSNVDGATNGGVQGGDSVYIYGAQFEQGSYPTSYIKSNSGSTTTRSAETANNSGDASTFNDSEGVLMFEGGSLSELDVTARYIQMSDGTVTANGIQLRYYTSTNSFQALYYTNSAYQAVLSYTLPNSSENNKIAFKYKQNDFALWVNGVEVATDTNGITGASLSKLKFDYNNFSDFYGNTKQIQYFDSALTDSELEKLTSWVSFSDMANGQLYTIE